MAVCVAHSDLCRASIVAATAEGPEWLRSLNRGGGVAGACDWWLYSALRCADAQAVAAAARRALRGVAAPPSGGCLEVFTCPARAADEAVLTALQQWRQGSLSG